MQLSHQQMFNQALIMMSVLLYQVDGKVTLTEQDYLDGVVEQMDWDSPICVEAFLNEAIFKTRQAIDSGEQRQMLREMKQDLGFDADKALEVAMTITGVDGERSDEETELLSLLTHKLLAKQLVSKASLS